MNDAQIKHMVNRFLSWKLPNDFRPDAGISFKAEFNEHTPFPMKHEPSGTNLLNANQAEAMIRHLLEGLPPVQHVDLPQDVINLVIAAREFWEVAMDDSDESAALDAALEAFASRVPYENEPAVTEGSTE